MFCLFHQRNENIKNKKGTVSLSPCPHSFDIEALERRIGTLERILHRGKDVAEEAHNRIGLPLEVEDDHIISRLDKRLKEVETSCQRLEKNFQQLNTNMQSVWNYLLQHITLEEQLRKVEESTHTFSNDSARENVKEIVQTFRTNFESHKVTLWDIQQWLNSYCAMANENDYYDEDDYYDQFVGKNYDELVLNGLKTLFTPGSIEWYS